MKKNLCIAIVGPTASGKSALALELAKVVKGELICLDSTTVYRGFDIGSSKPTLEERNSVPHHLLDILDPLENFTAFDFVQKACAAISDIESRGKLPIVVGGTYFYLRALQNGMFPVNEVPESVVEEIEKEYSGEEDLDSAKMHADLKAQDDKAALNIHPNDRYRLVRALSILRHTGKKPSELQATPLNPDQTNRVWMKYAFATSRHLLSDRILRRTDQMLQAGLVKETKSLLEKYPKARALSSIGYAEAVRFIQGSLGEKELRNEIIEKTRQLAKRQVTWLRSDPEVRYIDTRDLDQMKLEINNLQYALGN